jgi:ribonuclease P protein component
LKGEIYLKKPADFARVHKQGKYINNRLISLKSHGNGLSFARWGIMTGKKLGKAVIRNRVKRRLREILRQANLKPGNDIVIMARSGAVTADFMELTQAVLGLLKKGGLSEADETVSPVVN